MLGARQLGVAVLTFGGVVALTALLPPSEFAVYGYATLVFTLGLAVGDLGLGASAIRSERPATALPTSLGAQLVFWPPLLLLAVAGLLAGGGAALAVDGAVLAAGFMFVSLQALPTALLERDQRFQAIGWIEVLQRGGFVALAVGLVAAVDRDGALVAVAAAAAGLAGWLAALAASGWGWRPALPRRGSLREVAGFAAAWWGGRVANQLNYACYPLLGGLLFSAHDVGLMVWALTVSSLPAMGAALVARAVFPALARVTEARERLAIYRRVFGTYLALSVPLATTLLVFARPVTEAVFGARWEGGVGLLRIECVTSTLGLVLTPVAPLLYLVLDPRRVRALMIAWAAATWALTLALAPAVGFYAASVASVATASLVLAAFEVELRRAGQPSLVRMAAAPVAVCAAAAAAAVPLVGLADGRAATAALCVLVVGVQLAAVFVLRLGGRPLALLRGEPL